MKKIIKKTYIVKYYFDGNGETKIKADSKEMAEAKWRLGAYKDSDDEEWGENYELKEII